MIFIFENYETHNGKRELNNLKKSIKNDLLTSENKLKLIRFSIIKEKVIIILKK